jgi:hypothetical protein
MTTPVQFDELLIDGEQIWNRVFDIRTSVDDLPGATLDVSQTALQRSEAIQRTLDAANAAGGGAVVIPPGEWLLDRQAINPTFHGLLIPEGVHVVGMGKGVSVLKMRPGALSNEWYLLHVYQTRDCSIRNLTLDGNIQNITTAEEQVHLLQVRESSNVDILDVEFVNSGGDGIRWFGEPSTPCLNLNVERCWFHVCYRSGITWQREVNESRVRDSLFERINDQSIDFEMSGSGGRDNIIEGNTLDHRLDPVGDPAASAYAMTFSGASESDANANARLNFSNNKVYGALHGVRLQDITLEDNWVLWEDGAFWNAPAVDFSGWANRIRFVRNFIQSDDRACVSLEPRDGIIPFGCSFEQNTFRSDTSGLSVATAIETSVINNRFERYGVVAGAVGCSFRGTIAGGKDYLCTQNEFIGWVTGFDVDGTTQPMDGVAHGSNLYRDCTNGQQFNAGVSNWRQLGADKFVNVTTPFNSILSNIEPVIVGGLFRTSICILVGTADPTAGAGVAAGKGSLYLRDNGSAYFKNGVGADTDWTLIT